MTARPAPSAPDSVPAEPALPARLPKWQVAVAALYLLRGAVVRRDSEDIALKCFELAPRRFGWRTYPQLAPVRAALRLARRADSGPLVSGDHSGWLLTPSGVSWCETHLPDAKPRRPLRGWSALERREAEDLRRLLRQPLHTRWQSGQRAATRPEVAHTLRYTADAPVAAVIRRLDDLSALARFAGLSEVERYLDWLRSGAA